MDVLYPTIELIDGIPYRVNHSDDYNVLKDAETTPYIEFGKAHHHSRFQFHSYIEFLQTKNNK